MVQTEVARISDQLGRALEGPAWHGPSFIEAIEGLSARDAEARPLPAGHSIHEVAAHIAAWLEIVGQRVAGASPRITDEMDWPGGTDWPTTVARVRDAASHLRSTVNALTPADLDRHLANPGDDWTVYATLHGVIQHVLYHTGQIAILKKGAAR